MEQLQQKNVDMMARFKAMEVEVRDANTQRDLANQHYVSIDFEFGEHKKRFQRREQELVAQIAESNSVDECGGLKEKIKLLTEKGTALESQLWQSESKYRTEIDELEIKLTTAIARCNSLDTLKEQHEKLQREYNEISDQVMDYINELDQLKNAQSSHTKLEERVAELQKQLQLAQSENEDHSAKGEVIRRL